MNEIRIALCDDEKTHLKLLEQCVHHCPTWEHFRRIVHSYNSGQSLLDAVKSGKIYDYVFLDINMPEMNGLELCSEILKITLSSSIIFVSTHVESQPSIDMYYPAMLLSKPYTQKNFDNVIKAFLARKEAIRQFEFTDIVSGEKHSIPCRDVYLLSMADHHLIIRTVRGIYESASLNLRDVAREYATECFYRCHKSYMINLRYYDSHDYSNVYLLCGGKRVAISISKGTGNDIKEAYLKKIVGGLNAF